VKERYDTFIHSAVFFPWRLEFAVVLKRVLVGTVGRDLIAAAGAADAGLEARVRSRSCNP